MLSHADDGGQRHRQPASAPDWRQSPRLLAALEPKALAGPTAASEEVAVGSRGWQHANVSSGPATAEPELSSPAPYTAPAWIAELQQQQQPTATREPAPVELVAASAALDDGDDITAFIVCAEGSVGGRRAVPLREVFVGIGRIPSLCATACPLYTRSTNIFATSISEAIMRPNRRSLTATSGGVPWTAAARRLCSSWRGAPSAKFHS
jgi:hypothetical protein